MKKYIFIVTISISMIFLWLGGMAYWQYKNTAVKDAKDAGWQTYTNNEFGYSVDYPSNWTYREFPDTQTGAGFRPLNSQDQIASECVTVDARGTAGNEYNTLFSEYVKKAAPIEIQNYEKLNSIEPVISTDGSAGYKTTWIYRTLNGQEKISLPITYFENKKIVQMENNQLKLKTVQIVLNSEDCREIYAQMIPALKIFK